MKVNYKILFFLFLTLQYTYAQVDSIKFKISSYYLNDVPYNIKTKIIKQPKSKVDIFFYKNHFNKFYGVHKRKIKRVRLKNKEVIEWAFDNRTKDLNQNWLEIYTYDSKGKLIEYKYSGCTICSQFPYGYRLFYNENNDIVEQQTYYLKRKFYQKDGDLVVGLDFKGTIIRTIKLTYDTHRNINQLQEFSNNKIQTLIEIIE